MSINERIKALRKQLGYNQEEFGKKIGLKKSAASWIEQDGNTVTDQNIRMICETFNVAETWLRTGEGPQQRETREALLDKLAEQYSLSPDGVAGKLTLSRLYGDARDEATPTPEPVETPSPFETPHPSETPVPEDALPPILYDDGSNG